LLNNSCLSSLTPCQYKGVSVVQMLALPWRNHSTLTVHGRSVDLEEGESVIGVDSTGSILWDASQILLDWIVANRSRVDLSVVLELGGGTGALSVALSWLGAEKVVCTDLEHALPLIRRNVAKNSAEDTVSVAELVLGSELDWSSSPITLAVASDTVYSSAMVQPLCATLRSVLSHDAATVVLLCNKVRSASLIRELEAALAALPVRFKTHNSGEHVIHELRSV